MNTTCFNFGTGLHTYSISTCSYPCMVGCSVLLQFLQDVLDTLFSLLDDNIDKYGPLVFQSLVGRFLGSTVFINDQSFKVLNAFLTSLPLVLLIFNKGAWMFNLCVYVCFRCSSLTSSGIHGITIFAQLWMPTYTTSLQEHWPTSK